MTNEQTIPQFLLDMLEKQYGKTLTEEILQGYYVKRKSTIRVNTLKSSLNIILKVLENEQINYQIVENIPNAIIIDDEEKIKKLTIFESGEIYLQSLSSMLPPIILEPQKNIDILDMAAAPGSKTSEIAALTNNETMIMACEINKIRFERLKYNLNKLGVTCVNPLLTDAKLLDDYFAFDQILLDAPCSGSGTYNINDKNAKISLQLINNSKKAQIELLKKASKILKVGGKIVYSTCSILADENEEVIKTILKDHRLVLETIPMHIINKLPLLPTLIPNTICIMPNEFYEGFFVAVLRKVK